MSKAWSSCWYRERVMTGPKTSSQEIFMRGSTSVRTVGCINDPSRVPPVLSRAPCRTASRIQVSTRMAARSSINGPIDRGIVGRVSGRQGFDERE